MKNHLVILITFITSHLFYVEAMNSNIPSLQQLCLNTIKNECDIPDLINSIDLTQPIPDWLHIFSDLEDQGYNIKSILFTGSRAWLKRPFTYQKILEGHTGRISSLVKLSDGLFASGSYDRTLRIWNVSSGECLHTLKGHTGWVMSARKRLDEKLVSRSRNKVLCVYDTITGECLENIKVNSVDWKDWVAELSDGRLVGGSCPNGVPIFDGETGVCLQRLFGHTSWVSCVAELSDDRFVTGSNDRTLRIWNLSSDECLQTLKGHTGFVRSITKLSDNRLISGSDDNTLRIWDIESGECLQILEGHTGWINCVTEVYPGLVASGAEDSTLRIWDTMTGKCLQVFKEPKSRIYCLKKLSDGRFVSGGLNGTLHIWDISIDLSPIVCTLLARVRQMYNELPDVDQLGMHEEWLLYYEEILDSEEIITWDK